MRGGMNMQGRRMSPQKSSRGRVLGRGGGRGERGGGRTVRGRRLQDLTTARTQLVPLNQTMNSERGGMSMRGATIGGRWGGSSQPLKELEKMRETIGPNTSNPTEGPRTAWRHRSEKDTLTVSPSSEIVKGRGIVQNVFANYGFIEAPFLSSNVFLVPSILTKESVEAVAKMEMSTVTGCGDAGAAENVKEKRRLTDVLQKGDIVEFVASQQVPKNGCGWQALHVNLMSRKNAGPGGIGEESGIPAPSDFTSSRHPSPESARTISPLNPTFTGPPNSSGSWAPSWPPNSNQAAAAGWEGDPPFIPSSQANSAFLRPSRVNFPAQKNAVDVHMHDKPVGLMERQGAWNQPQPSGYGVRKPNSQPQHGFTLFTRPEENDLEIGMLFGENQEYALFPSEAYGVGETIVKLASAPRL